MKPRKLQFEQEFKFSKNTITILSKWIDMDSIEQLRSNAGRYASMLRDSESQLPWRDQKDQLKKIAKCSADLSISLSKLGRSAKAEIQTVMQQNGQLKYNIETMSQGLRRFSDGIQQRLILRKEQDRVKNHAQLVAMIDAVTRQTGMKPSRSDPSPFYEICFTVFESLGLKSPNRSIAAFLNFR
jgi:hypothetical protein